MRRSDHAFVGSLNDELMVSGANMRNGVQCAGRQLYLLLRFLLLFLLLFLVLLAVLFR